MARKDIVLKEIAIAQSMATSFTSAPTFVKNLDNVCYQIDITTTNSIGTFKVQASLDYSVNASNVVVNSGHWIDLPLGGGTPFANAANDDIIINLNQLPFIATRLVYTSTTPGTGHCDVWIAARQIGG